MSNQQYQPPSGPPPQQQQSEQQPSYASYPHEPSNNPWAQEESQGFPPAQHQPQAYQQQPQGYQQPPQDYQQQQQDFPSQPQHAFQPPTGNAAPGLPPRRSDTDSAYLPTGQDRTEQMETFQAYEASKPQSQEDQAQETLQREFPGVDSSLIAAIWGDSRDMGQTREMLQALSQDT